MRNIKHKNICHAIKTRMSVILAILASYTFMIAQKTIILTFTATNNGLHQPLDSINMLNLKQGGDTTLTGNDTILQLDQGIGMDEMTPTASGPWILYPVAR